MKLFIEIIKKKKKNLKNRKFTNLKSSLRESASHLIKQIKKIKENRSSSNGPTQTPLHNNKNNNNNFFNSTNNGINNILDDNSNNIYLNNNNRINKNNSNLTSNRKRRLSPNSQEILYKQHNSKKDKLCRDFNRTPSKNQANIQPETTKIQLLSPPKLPFEQSIINNNIDDKNNNDGNNQNDREEMLVDGYFLTPNKKNTPKQKVKRSNRRSKRRSKQNKRSRNKNNKRNNNIGSIKIDGNLK